MFRTSFFLLALATCASAIAGGPWPAVSELPARAELPDPLITFQGEKVVSKAQWTDVRRPELQDLFQHYMYGYLPPRPPQEQFKVVRTDENFLGGKAILKEIAISLGPDPVPKINLLLIVPKLKSGKAPVFVGLNFCGNHTVTKDPLVALPTSLVRDNCGGKDGKAVDAGRGLQEDVWNVDLIIDRGYALATFYQGDIDPDTPEFTDGIHPHYFQPGQTKPGQHEWGTIAAWAWGYHRVVDYLVTDNSIDATRIAAVGHSRNGKTALLAGAFDDRIKLVIPHQAGCGGSAPSRHKIGEQVKQINDRFPHWFNDEFALFNDQVDKLPFDQNCLVALCAPRPVLLSNAVEDTWADPDGQFQVLQGADAVYHLLGSKGLEPGAKPELGKLISSPLGYYLRAGKHSMNRDDWTAFLDFADKNFSDR